MGRAGADPSLSAPVLLTNHCSLTIRPSVLPSTGGAAAQRTGAGRRSGGLQTMGSVFQKTYTRPVPAGAEVLTIKAKRPRRIARWAAGSKRIEAEVLTTSDGRD